MTQPSKQALDSGVTADWYRAIIGPHEQDYYLRQFKRFDADGRTRVGWNGAAFWATLNWMLYRRMWGGALAYGAVLLGLVLLIFGLGRLVFDYSNARAVLLLLLLLPVTFVVPALYADGWYYRHCQRKMAAALRRNDSSEEAREALRRQAPQQRHLPWLLAANGALLALAALLLNELRENGSLGAPQAAADERVLPAAPSVPPPAEAAAVAPAPAVSAPVVVASVAAPVVSQVVVAAAPAAATPGPQAKPAATAAPAAPLTKAATAQAPQAPRAVWVVQVGAYAQQSNARQALSRVQALGLDAQAYESRRGRLIRVRVGPYTREDEAEQAAARIRAQQLPALVVRQRR
jgi:cell division septation protein DedD